MKYFILSLFLIFSGVVMADDNEGGNGHHAQSWDNAGFSESFESSTFGNFSASGGSISTNGGWSSNSTDFSAQGFSSLGAGCTDCDFDVENFGSFDFNASSISESEGDSSSAGSGWSADAGWSSNFSGQSWGNWGELPSN